MDKIYDQPSAPAKKQKGNLGHMARYYDLIMFLLTLGRERTLRKMTLDLAQVKPGDKVLEIGCGTGTLSIVAKVRVGASGEVKGIDIAPEMVEVANRKAKQKGIDASFQIGSIEKIPFPNNRFDVVLCSFMIFHMPEVIRRKGFTEIYRVLKSGRHLFIIDTVDLHQLSPVLKENSFSEIEITGVKLNFMKIWALRGKAA